MVVDTSKLVLEDASTAAASVYLRSIIGGPPGSGKSWTALMLASAFAEREGSFVGVIETERGRTTHYAELFPHKLIRLEKYDTATYLAALTLLYKHGCKAVVIDSLTHAWTDGVRPAVDAARPKFNNNQWSAWSVGDEMQRQFINTIMRYPGHVVATSRMKIHTEIETEGPNRGKPVEKGMRFEQRDGIHYEFDLAMQMSAPGPDLTIIKSVLGEFLPVGLTLSKPGEVLVERIFAWFDRDRTPQRKPAGEPVAPKAQPPVAAPSARLPATQPASANFDEEGDALDINWSIEGDEPTPAPAPVPAAQRPAQPAQPAKPTNGASTKSWNVPAVDANDDETPISGQQVSSLKKMGAALGYGENVPGMTNRQARGLIARLSAEYNRARGNGNMGAAGAPGINQRAAEERQTAAAAPATRRNDSPFGDDDIE